MFIFCTLLPVSLYLMQANSFSILVFPSVLYRGQFTCTSGRLFYTINFLRRKKKNLQTMVRQEESKRIWRNENGRTWHKAKNIQYQPEIIMKDPSYSPKTNLVPEIVEFKTASDKVVLLKVQAGHLSGHISRRGELLFRWVWVMWLRALWIAVLPMIDFDASDWHLDWHPFGRVSLYSCVRNNLALCGVAVFIFFHFVLFLHMQRFIQVRSILYLKKKSL